MAIDLLSQLNPAQREAVTHPGGPLLIIAGAGSGKTRVITHRIAWLIREQGVDPRSVFAATFTNKAAEEMRTRVGDLLGRRDLGLPIATFHSLCARLLRSEAPRVGRTERYVILDENDQRGLIKETIKALGLRPEDCPPAHAQWVINQAKMNLQRPADFAENLPRPEDEWIVDVYRLYQRRLDESDAFDFEDLIGSVVRLLEGDAERREHYQQCFGHVLVDEYQDTNTVQYRLVRLLGESHGNLCVVGDEDQSIYSWRGANLDNILSFQEDFAGAKVVKLEQNYRSSGNILRAASAVIANNSERIGKTLWTEEGDGDPLEILQDVNEHAEAQRVEMLIEHLRGQGIPRSEMAIFYRVNALSRVFEERFLEEGIPYRIYGGVRFFERREIKDLIAYLQLVANSSNGVALHRVVNVPRRGVGNKTVQRVVQHADSKQISLWKGLQEMLEAKEIKGKAATGLREFSEQLAAWQAEQGSLGLAGVLRRIVEETGYLEYLKRSDPLSYGGREENVEELVRSLEEFEQMRPEATLDAYLEKVALESATDDYDHGADCVSLMTLHCAKGLEFDVVFLVGMEEPIFPNRRAVEEGRGLEEERRLFYVGLTRARKRVYLCHAQSRFLHGQVQWSMPSQFLAELPTEVLDSHGAPPPQRWRAAPRRSQNSVAPSPPPPRQSSMTFQTGQRVAHGVFGEGTILGIKGEGAMKRLVVRFEGDELVELLEQYADLAPAEGGP